MFGDKPAGVLLAFCVSASPVSVLEFWVVGVGVLDLVVNCDGVVLVHDGQFGIGDEGGIKLRKL